MQDKPRQSVWIMSLLRVLSYAKILWLIWRGFAYLPDIITKRPIVASTKVSFWHSYLILTKLLVNFICLFENILKVLEAFMLGLKSSHVFFNMINGQ